MGAQITEAQKFLLTSLSFCLFVSPTTWYITGGGAFPSVVSSALDTPTCISILSHHLGRKQRGNSRHDGTVMAQLLIRNLLRCVLIINEVFTIQNWCLWVLEVCWTRPTKMLPPESLSSRGPNTHSDTCWPWWWWERNWQEWCCVIQGGQGGVSREPTFKLVTTDEKDSIWQTVEGRGSRERSQHIQRLWDGKDPAGVGGVKGRRWGCKDVKKQRSAWNEVVKVEPC